MRTVLLSIRRPLLRLATMVQKGKGASIIASALWTTQNDPSMLTRFWPPVCWNAAHALSMAARDEGKIPEGGSPVV
jgi:hypothetical protein